MAEERDDSALRTAVEELVRTMAPRGESEAVIRQAVDMTVTQWPLYVALGERDKSLAEAKTAADTTATDNAKKAAAAKKIDGGKLAMASAEITTLKDRAERAESKSKALVGRIEGLMTAQKTGRRS
jgi:hypothetical protein